MRPVLAEFALRYPGVNNAAVVSQWSMNYMSIVVPATLACVLTRDQAIDFWRDDSVLRLDAGQPLALHFAGPLPALAAAERADYFSRWVHEHLAPLFATLALAGGWRRRFCGAILSRSGTVRSRGSTRICPARALPKRTAGWSRSPSTRAA